METTAAEGHFLGTMSAMKRVKLSLEERKQVIEEHDKGASERKLAECFNCGKTQINRILKQRDLFEKEWQERSGPRAKKAKRSVKLEEVNHSEENDSRKTSRVVLNLEDRMKVIEERDKGASERKLAEDFQCSKTQINRILKKRDSVEKEWRRSKNPGMKRKRQEKFGHVNRSVLEWFQNARAEKILVSSVMLKEKALQIAWNAGIVNFSASNGWLDRFRARHNISFRYVTEESRPEGRLASVVGDYAARDVFSMNEFGIFLHCLPSEKPRGTVTVVLCANRDGEKEPPLVIGKPTQCCEEKLQRLGVSWGANREARMTYPIFQTWLSNFDSTIGEQGRKVLLVLEDSPCHSRRLGLKNVELQFMPSDEMQPFARGIAQAFKHQYRRRVLRHLLARMDDTSSVTELADKINMSDAVSWITSAWKEVGGNAIAECFRSFGLVEASEYSPEIKLEYQDDVKVLSRAAGIDYDKEALRREEDLECFDDIIDEREEGSSMTGEESEESGGGCNEADHSQMTPQEILHQLDKCHRATDSSDYNWGDKINKLFNDLKETFEEEIVKKKFSSLKQT